MSEPITGWYTFLHHDQPIEWTHDLAQRLAYIETRKPVHERAIRLRCIVAVPVERLPVGYVEAWWGYVEAWRGSDEARRGSDEAWRGYDEARRGSAPKLLALALALVPDAPWNGHGLTFEGAA